MSRKKFLDSQLNVFLNTFPLTVSKTGIGYCVHNLFQQLQNYPEISIIPTHQFEEDALGQSRGASMSEKVLNFLKKTLKNHYPTKLMARLIKIYEGSRKNINPRKIYEALRSGKPCIYHETSHMFLEDFEDFIGKIKIVSDIHDLSFLLYPQWHTQQLVAETGKAIKRIIQSDIIITKSQFIKNEVVKNLNFDPNKIKVVPNAAGADYYPLAPDDLKTARRQLIPIIGEKPFILYVGTVEPRKNINLLLDAFKTIKNETDANVVIAGRFGWQYTAILEHPQKIGIEDRVIFLQYVSQTMLLNLYNTCEFMVYPSLYEGFGMPPLEAMHCGATVVVSNASSIPEVVGEAGLYFSPNSAEELAEQIKTIVHNPEIKADFKKRAVARAGMFSWQQSAQKTVEIYKNIIST